MSNRSLLVYLLAILLVLCILCLGCGGPSNTKTMLPQKQEGRLEIVSFQDLTVAGHDRSMMVIRDKETGKEYIAVIGAGVTETHCVYSPATKTTICGEE